MSLKIRRLFVGALLATSTTGATLVISVEAASAAPTVTASVRTGGGPLNLRTAPSTQSATAGQLPNGARITIACQVSGQNVRGAVRASAQWDKLTNGRYVSHAYVQASASIQSCAPFTAAAPGFTVRTDGGYLNVRYAATSQATKIGAIANGANVALACRVNGETVRGTVRLTAEWDKLASGGYVSHAYVQASTSLPACSQPTPAPAPAPTPPPAPGPPASFTGTVDTGGGALNIRSGASADAALVGGVANGATMTMSCAVNGQYVAGQVRATTQWNRLASGNYVSHAYVRTLATLPACAGGAPPVSGGTGPVGSMTNAQFIASSVTPAQQGYREFGVPASVTIAQAILESGWGRSGLTKNDRNFFGIKCFNGSPGPIANGCHTYATYECEPTCYATYASFRTYASATDSFRDHGRFLTTNSRYRPAFNHTRDANRFLYEIWKAGYATSPTYVENTKALMQQYNLYQYDKF